MEQRNLTFVDTFTVEQFKEEVKVAKLEVKKNPHTDKLFFTFGAKTGAVASAGIPKNPMVSKVIGDDGAEFFLLHEEGTGGAPVIATF